MNPTSRPLTPIPEMKMDDALTDKLAASEPITEPVNPDHLFNEIKQLRADYQLRLVMANLRTEAVRAGMVDLDGLKLINVSEASLDVNDAVVDGPKIMEDLRRQKPWLFGASSSSSVAAVPLSKSVRQKTALEMTDEEYASARALLTKRRL